MHVNNQDPGGSLDPTTEAIVESGVVAVLRAASADYFLPIVEVLVDAGITAIEVTLTTPQATLAIENIARRFASNVCVGAGSVITADDASRCIDAGAAFVVSPAFVPDVLEQCVGAGVPCYPAALTPTEFATAARAGAALIKLFPASVFGPGYVRSLREPLPGLRIMPTGGIGPGDVGTWLRAGAETVGLGSSLTGDALNGGSLVELRRRADEAVAQVAGVRERA
ncbi:bifunctional 4-hydroxy-2-oxoglutarate aldolase/2-dehydro-3-deoxy-phosphogluconate aldolase [Terrabacter terrigena]|uniref:Bifunctional 4-hydroxy-2-oxoglutarate aldolase/2-dehydro-3-deoxy-phosphogluconate aldolase n=1 Tax=Terrabacter terrigena TaxID=574718 RepID=A0ABW3MSN7_9MICO